MEDKKQLFRTLAIANFLLYLGFNVWRAIFNNFAVEELGVRADQIGLIQAVREVPGLMGFVLGFLVLWLSEMRMMGLSVLLMGLGLILSGMAYTVPVLLVGTMVMSIGFHFFYSSNSSVVLMAVGKEDAPQWLGRLRSISSMAAVAGTVIIAVVVEGVEFGPLHIEAWGYRNLLYAIGGLVLAGSLVAMRNGRQGAGLRIRRKVIFRRDYWLYYLLTFMMGSRRHIFTTFAIFFLVEVYGISVRETALLFLVNNLISSYASAQLGKLVARWGERKVLTINFAGLIGVFSGYAYVPYLPVLYGLFVLDHIFFGFNLAVDSYFQKIAHSPEEITSNVSMAQTINHVSALVVPILGGLLWEAYGPQATFIAGVGVAVVSLVLVQFIRTEAGPPPLPAAAGRTGHRRWRLRGSARD
ncbi:MAG: MFS transporter [Anaerolineae bacterium]|jgi:predicted MFS family arabinose efflux permease